ncbi:MAG: sialidase family protein [Thermoanaerobaculia bacterium]
MYSSRPGIHASLAAGLLCAACSPAPSLDAVEESGVPAAVTVRSVDPPSGPGAMAPELAASDGGALLTWLEPTDDGHVLYLAELQGRQWTAAGRIATGDAFFANWADRPTVAEAADGSRFAHWLWKLGADTYAYGAELARSGDGGATWEPLGLLHDDASASEHGFVSYAPLADGGLQAFWLDGREMPGGGAMQLRSVRLGASAPGASTLLDERVCECCDTSAATTAAGPLVVYRDRGPSEVRDVAVVRATGEGWSEPVVIHADGWQIHGCPVNGPAVAADGNRVAVAWFTAAPRARVAVVFSDDAGASFGAPAVVDDGDPLGRVDVALDARGRALVSWMGSTDDGAEIRWRRVERDGDVGPVGVVAATTAKRSAGVPRMLRRGDELLFAWVEDAEPSRLRVAVVEP